METLYAILPLAGRYILVAGLLMALYWMLWRKQATHRAKRIYLLALPFMALAITLTQIEVYKPDPVVVTIEKKVEAVQNISMAEAIPMTTSGTTFAPTEVNEAEEVTPVTLAPMEAVEEAINLSTWDIITIVYISILVALCIPFVVGFVQLMMLSKKANKQQDKEKNIRILTGQAIKAPFSFYRSIFLPSNLTDTQRRMILSHEEAHIQHRHYLDMWISALVTRLFWWNPFLWWANNELRNIHEFEADGVVLNTGEDLYTYQTILIEEVMHGDIVIANGFNHSFIRRRFIEMAKSTNHRMSKWGKIGTSVWMLLIVALFCCSVGKAETIYKTVITHEPQELVAEAVTETAMEESPILIDTLTLSKDKPFLVFQDSVAILQADDDYMLFDDTVVVNFDESPLTVEANNLEQAELLKGLLNTISEIGKEITPEEYEELQALSDGSLPTQEHLTARNKRLKETLNQLLLQNLSQLQTELLRRQANELVNSGFLNESNAEELGKASVSKMTNNFENQRQIVIDFIKEWLFISNIITKEGYEQLKSTIPNPESIPSLEELQRRETNRAKARVKFHLAQAMELDKHLGTQLNNLFLKHGWPAREDEFEFSIEFINGTTIFQKTKDGWRTLKHTPKSFSSETIANVQFTQSQRLETDKNINEIVDDLMFEWLIRKDISETNYLEIKNSSSSPEKFPSLEEFNQDRREKRRKDIVEYLLQIRQRDESLSKYLIELIEKYGISPENEIIEIPIFFKNGTTVTYQKKGNTLGVVSKTIQPSKPVSENLRKAKENEFVIEGFVDENITDSCYNIYLADEHFLIQDEPVATVPVVNKRFTYVVNIDKMTAGRLRCIFPGGELCENTISLYFVPGETVSLFVHNGFYNLDKSPEYGNKVTRAMEIAREETNWETPHQPKIKGDAWKEVEHEQNDYNLLVKEVYFNDKETVLRIACEGYTEGMTLSKNAFIKDNNGKRYKLIRAIKGNIGANNEPEVRIFGIYLAFEPVDKDANSLTFYDSYITIRNIKEANKGRVIY